MVGLDLGATAVGMIAFLSLLKVRATFALELNLEQKLIYINHEIFLHDINSDYLC